jgi:endonuclease/exonuclease/phosphatase family metal-dependent hydrolase
VQEAGMARKTPGIHSEPLISQRLWSSLKSSIPLALGIAAVILAMWWVARTTPTHRPTTNVPSGPSGTVDCLLCFWNVENLFDDRDDVRPAEDKPYDNWFAHDPQALRLKLQHLSEALVSLNDGRGPDVIAAVEVESVRAAELLKDALNERLVDDTLKYRTVLMKEVDGGRHIAPAVITRLRADVAATRLLDRKRRILETHLSVNGYDLTLVAAHWTSRISDKTGERRDRYADTIYRAYREKAARNPEVDFVVCGDFNDSPDDPSVASHLHATGDRTTVAGGSGAELLLNLMGGKDPRYYGTHVHAGTRLIYDQIVVSRGMLDTVGWSCDPDSVRTIDSLTRRGDPSRRPWRFGGEKDSKHARGYSDHFPITVRLKVQGN